MLNYLIQNFECQLEFTSVCTLASCAPEQPPPPPPPSVPQTSQGTSTVTTKPKPAKRAKTDDDHHEPVNRSKQPEKWKVNVKKNARLRGEAYVGVGGTVF